MKKRMENLVSVKPTGDARKACNSPGFLRCSASLTHAANQPFGVKYVNKSTTLLSVYFLKVI
jgi:hypothetical protein